MSKESQSYKTTSLEQTEALGAQLAAELSPGDVVVISGDLGSGKTTLIRGAIRALGSEELVTSPSFVIGVTYQGSKGPIAHLDLYRFDEGVEGEDPGLLDPFFGPNTITFIEWPERAVDSELLRDRVTRVVKLEHLGGDTRQIKLS